VYVCWLDDTRARAALILAHATANASAAAAGAKRSSLPGWADPADEFAAAGEKAARPAAGGRAAEIAAFVAATGGDT
jgi:hypothetical protein